MSSFSSTEEQGPSVYPNPSPGTTNIKFNNTYRGKILINLYSASNEKITLKETEKLSNDLSIEINTSGFRKGIYLLEILSGVKRSTRRLVVR